MMQWDVNVLVFSLRIFVRHLHAQHARKWNRRFRFRLRCRPHLSNWWRFYYFFVMLEQTWIPDASPPFLYCTWRQCLARTRKIQTTQNDCKWNICFVKNHKETPLSDRGCVSTKQVMTKKKAIYIVMTLANGRITESRDLNSEITIASNSGVTSLPSTCCWIE